MVEWESHQRSDMQIAAQFEYFQQGVLSFFEQQLLCEEILARVTRDAQLGKAEDFHILAFGGHHKFLDFLCVGADIRQLNTQSVLPHLFNLKPRHAERVLPKLNPIAHD